MFVRHYLVNEVKHIPLFGLDGHEWAGAVGGWDEGEADWSVTGAWGAVPYLYRAVDIRAKTIAGMPWTLFSSAEPGRDVKDNPRYRGITRGMRTRLYLTEAALCLYGAAYWLKETNQAGHNLTPRWVMPTSVVPRFDRHHGLIGFERTTASGAQRFRVDQVAHFWMPNLSAELGPGAAPARVALASARVLRNLDLFTEGFFKRGAIKPTLLTVEGNPSRAELERLENWWQRVVSGMRNAWQSIAVRSTVQPVTIGEGLAELETDHVAETQRQNIACALGVPYTMLSASAANYATSLNDKMTFLTSTVIPQARMIEESFNDQIASQAGVRLRFLPERLEEMQQYEVEKAQAVMALVQKPILTVNEARELMGYAPLSPAELEAAEDTADNTAEKAQRKD